MTTEPGTTPDVALGLQRPAAALAVTPHGTPYRGEIDGLRAIAVVSVVLFHLGVARVGGGFVGVDVFFVISGFLITGNLLADMKAERFSSVPARSARGLATRTALPSSATQPEMPMMSAR